MISPSIFHPVVNIEIFPRLVNLVNPVKKNGCLSLGILLRLRRDHENCHGSKSLSAIVAYKSLSAWRLAPPPSDFYKLQPSVVLPCQTRNVSSRRHKKHEKLVERGTVPKVFSKSFSYSTIKVVVNIRDIKLFVFFRAGVAVLCLRHVT